MEFLIASFLALDTLFVCTCTLPAIAFNFSGAQAFPLEGKGYLILNALTSDFERGSAKAVNLSSVHSLNCYKGCAYE